MSGSRHARSLNPCADHADQMQDQNSKGGFTLMSFGTRGVRARWRQRRHESSRGATVVEYALGISLVALAGVGAVTWLEGSSSDAVGERGDAIGTPDLDEVWGSSTSTSASTSTSSSTTTTAPPAPPAVVITSALNPHNGNCANSSKWTPTVIVTVEDESGNPVHKAVISATWVKQPSNETITVSFETKPDGTATFSLLNLQADNGAPDYVSGVTFTITGVTPEGGTTTAPDPPLSASIPEEPCS